MGGLWGGVGVEILLPKSRFNIDAIALSFEPIALSFELCKALHNDQNLGHLSVCKSFETQHLCRSQRW